METSLLPPARSKRSHSFARLLNLFRQCRCLLPEPPKDLVSPIAKSHLRVHLTTENRFIPNCAFRCCTRSVSALKHSGVTCTSRTVRKLRAHSVNVANRQM